MTFYSPVQQGCFFISFLGNPLRYSFLSGIINFVRCCYETTPFPIMLLSLAQTSTLLIALGEGSPLNALRKHREKGKGRLSLISAQSYLSKTITLSSETGCYPCRVLRHTITNLLRRNHYLQHQAPRQRGLFVYQKNVETFLGKAGFWAYIDYR